MTEYIRREDAYTTLTDYYHHSTEIQHMALKEALDRVPAADVVEKKLNEVNLCESCKHSYPDCPSGDDDVLFGNGKGDDNICCCSWYEPGASAERNAADQFRDGTQMMSQKSIGDGVSTLIGLMRDYGYDCRDSDMCKDCQFCYFCENGWTPDGIADKLEELVSQAGERKTGKWINYIEDGFVECPFCHSATNCDGEISELHYCFNCGAKLEGDDE